MQQQNVPSGCTKSRSQEGEWSLVLQLLCVVRHPFTRTTKMNYNIQHQERRRNERARRFQTKLEKEHQTSPNVSHAVDSATPKVAETHGLCFESSGLRRPALLCVQTQNRRRKVLLLPQNA